MVFLSISEPIEEFMKRDKSTRMYDVDWCLFDSCISGRSLKNKNDIFGSGNHGNLNVYMSRTMLYNLFYEEPIYMYLMKDNYFRKLDFLSEEKKNTCAVWNMKRIPKYAGAEEKYPRIPEDRMLWKGDFDEQEEYLLRKFRELSENTNDCTCVIIDGKN